MSEFLSRMGYNEIYESVRLPTLNNVEIDILGVRRYKKAKPRIAIIEVKESDVDRVISQALQRRTMANRVWIAMHLGKEPILGYIIYKLSERREFLLKNGIGILIWDDVRRQICEPLRTTEIPENIHSQDYRNILFETIRQQRIN